MEIDAERAAPELIESLRSSDDESLDIAIADALHEYRLGGQLDALLSAQDPSSRRAGCVLARRRSFDGAVRALLRERSLDVNETVSKEAILALREELRSRGLAALVDDVLNSTGEARWVALDHIAQAAPATRDDPGARWDMLRALNKRLTDLEAQALNEVLRRGEQDYQCGCIDRRDRRRRESR